MTRRALRRLPFWLALVLVVGGAATAIALLVRDAPATSEGLPLGEQGVVAETSVRPRALVFGDQLVARVDVLVDRRRIDPESVGVALQFDPFTLAAPPRRVRVDHEKLTRLRIEYTLDCLAGNCVPDARFRELDLPAATLRHGDRTVAELEWPRVSISSRIGEVTGETTDEGRATIGISGYPWRADTRLAPATYRVDPDLLTTLLAGAALVLLATSLAFVQRAFPGAPLGLRLRRRRLTPLDRALVVLERAHERGIEQEQRLALDRLAQELRAGGAGELAGSARRLAWEPDTPGPDRTAALADRVRELARRRTNGRH